PDRFTNLEQNLCNAHGAFRLLEKDVKLSGLYPGKEWAFSLAPLGNNRSFYVRTYFVRAENSYHHYLLTAKGPMNTLREHADINRFFNGFGLLDGTNEMTFVELDALNNG